jgi:hypothetical protein
MKGSQRSVALARPRPVLWGSTRWPSAGAPGPADSLTSHAPGLIKM